MQFCDDKNFNNGGVYFGGLDWVQFNAPPDTFRHFGGGLHSQSLDCYWQINNKENNSI